MKRLVVWSAFATDDYFSILRHIAADDPEAAERLVDRIDKAAERLGGIPTGRPGRVTGTYEKSVSGAPYIVAYEIAQPQGGEEAVVIVRVIHEARDWPAESWPKS